MTIRAPAQCTVISREVIRVPAGTGRVVGLSVYIVGSLVRRGIIPALQVYGRERRRATVETRLGLELPHGHEVAGMRGVQPVREVVRDDSRELSPVEVLQISPVDGAV